MSYTVVISDQAEKELGKLEKEAAERIRGKLKKLREKVNEWGVDPDHYFDWLDKYNVHKIRVGDYRLFTDIDKDRKQLNILTIRHRENAYM